MAGKKFALGGRGRHPGLGWLIAALGAALGCSAGGGPTDAGAGTQAPLAFTFLSAHNHTCGVTTGNLAYCWGQNLDGQLGDGTTDQRHLPIPVAGGLSFKQIATSRSMHTCAVTTGNLAYCWGANGSGQLGDGSTTRRLTPTPVSGSLSFTHVSTSLHHSCGVTPGNLAYCWGANGSGQLGDGTTTARPTPTRVGGGLSFAQLSAGEAHTCGVTTDGLAYCWGRSDFYGRLGDGTTTQRLLPTPVAGGLTFARVSAAAAHTCGVTTGNLAYCWGSNNAGQLGDGTTTIRLAPTAVVGGLRFAQVSASPTGGYSCGVTTDNTTYCWGSNDQGELGDGTTTARLTPTTVSGGLRFTQVTAGAAHACAVAAGDVAYCWGFNGFGRLGDGTRDASSTPVRVGGGS